MCFGLTLWALQTANPGREICTRQSFLAQVLSFFEKQQVEDSSFTALQSIKLLASIFIMNVMYNTLYFRKRAPYIAYLTRCRQGLQTTQAHLERLLQRVLRDKEVANRYFTTVCVRLLLESKEKKIREFIQGKINADCGMLMFLYSIFRC